MANEQVLLVSKEDGVATLTLNRPERLNALSAALDHRFVEVCRELREDDEVRCVVVTGAGRGFSSGADLAGPLPGEEPPPAPGRRTRLSPFGMIGRVVLEFFEMEKPTIAAVNGVAAGAGFSLALSADIRIASEEARFSAIFVRRGLAPDTGTTVLLPRLIGLSRAYEMLYTGEIIGAQEAYRLGLVSRVVPPDELLPAARELALRIARGPSFAIELARRAVHRSLFPDLRAAVEFEGFAQNIAGSSEDAAEGRRSFLERRDPEFQGR